MTQTDLLEELKMEQVKTKQRVTDHGEVFTDNREVNAMLDLVKQETENIDSTFLEPACGTGNFLIEILRRKLAVVERKYRKVQNDYERYAFAALFSIYGIELLPDNVERCKERLYKLFTHQYTSIYKKVNVDYLKSAEFILDRNILCGNALTLKNEKEKPIVFSQWAFINPREVKRKDYVFEEMIPPDSHDLFDAHETSDHGKPVFIPKWINEYPPTKFKELFQQNGVNE